MLSDAVVHSAVMLEIDHNKRVCESLGTCGKIMLDFHTDYAKNCRSNELAKAWFIKIATTGVDDHLRRFWDNTANYGVMETCGFIIIPHEVAALAGAEVDEEEGEQENDSGVRRRGEEGERRERIEPCG